MDIKEVKEKVKKILEDAFGVAPVITPAPAPKTALATPPAPVAAVPIPYTLQDGTSILVLQAGQVPAVGDMVTNADGSLPAAGVLTLEDGSTLTVDATGLVTEVGAASPVTTDLAGAPPVPTLEERVSQIEAAIARAMQPKQFEVSKEEFEALKEENAKFAQAVKDMGATIASFGETPTSDPVTLTGSKKERFDRTNAKEEKLERIAGLIGDLRKHKAI